MKLISFSIGNEKMFNPGYPLILLINIFYFCLLKLNVPLIIGFFYKIFNTREQSS